MTRSNQNSMEFRQLLAISVLFFHCCCCCSSSASVVPEKRQFLLPRFLFKSSNDRAREQQIKIVEEQMPVIPESEITVEPVDAASLDDVPVNVFPIRRPQREPIARRPCYFSPIQCLLHTPDHDRKFANYPEFQQHARSVNREDQQPFMAGTVANMQISSPRVKAAVEALLVQKQFEQKMKAQRRMLRQSAMPPPAAVGTPEFALEQQQTQQHLSRHRLFGTPWRRGL